MNDLPKTIPDREPLVDPVNALTVDVEDYFQVSAFENTIERSNWDRIEHRIEQNMDRVLQMFDDYQVHATFFVLGWIAKRYPVIVRRIVDEGHELASHGHGHQRVVNLSKTEFQQDIVKAKGILEDLAGVDVRGYRAPSYSIGETNLWALSMLRDAGYEYSSSIYPVRHDLYGFPAAPRFIFRDVKSDMIEIPVTTVKLLNRTFPAGGGGFFRLYPYELSKWIIRRINDHEKQSAVFYFHPWELDPDQPRQQGISLKTRFRHYLNLDKTGFRLSRLAQDFKWGRIKDVFLSGRNIPDFYLDS